MLPPPPPPPFPPTCGLAVPVLQATASRPTSAAAPRLHSGANTARPHPYLAAGYGPGTTYDTETNNVGWYGHGADRQLDSTQPYTVVTQFHTDVGTGDLANVSRFYLQNGKRIGQ